MRSWSRWLLAFLVGPRPVRQFVERQGTHAHLRRHYNDHLYEKSEFFVPVLVDFFADGGVT